jgi:D-alanine-D-alanine ligase
MIIKPAHEGSTLGITIVKTVDQLQEAYATAAKFDSSVMAEVYVQGMEFTCPVLGAGETTRALPLIRIIAPDANFSYHNKYVSTDTQSLCPCGLPAEQERMIQDLVVASYRALGCRGWGRADMILRASDNQPFLLEMNTSPGMTSRSSVPRSAGVIGVSYEDLCVELLRAATLDLKPSKDWQPPR